MERAWNVRWLRLGQKLSHVQELHWHGLLPLRSRRQCGALLQDRTTVPGDRSPAKLKLATAGCPRNCSEALIKDIGFVAIGDGKWEIYIGGAGGSHVRKGDVMCTVDSEEAAIAYGGRFMQFYRENAKWSERTYDFVARVGIERIRAVIVEDCEGLGAALDAAMQASATPPMIPGRRRPLPRR